MYKNPLQHSRYLYFIDSPNAPMIDLSLNSSSFEDVSQSAEEYLSSESNFGNAKDYKDEVLRLVSHRDYVRDRYEKDVCGESITVSSGDLSFTGSLSKIDLVRNEYIANEKSNEVFSESSRDNMMHYQSGLEQIETNFKRIFSTIMVKDDMSGLIYDSYEEPKVYDERSIKVINSALKGHDQYFLSEDSEIDLSKRYFERNGQVFSQVESPSGSPKGNGYYEKNENQVNFIIESPSSEFTSRIFNSWSLSFKLTSDSIAKSGKIYYEKIGDDHIVSNLNAGDQIVGEYYEENLLASTSKKKYTLRYNSEEEHWYIAEITATDISETIGPEILKSNNIDAPEIDWVSVNKGE